MNCAMMKDLVGSDDTHYCNLGNQVSSNEHFLDCPSVSQVTKTTDTELRCKLATRMSSDSVASFWNRSVRGQSSAYAPRGPSRHETKAGCTMAAESSDVNV